MSNVEALMDSYYAWLRDKTAWKRHDKWTEITAPYLDRNNDYLQIYLRQEGDGYVLTDDGATIEGLLAEGCSLDSPKRKALLKMTLAGFGVSEEDGHLIVRATSDTFALKKHSLVQAMLAVGDMFFLAEPHVATLFMEDVRGWLEKRDVRFSSMVSFIGHSGFARKFDFLIPKSRSAPERVVKTINNPTKHAADSVIMDWLDTREIRPDSSRLYAVINDNNRVVSSNVVDALAAYEVKPVLWSQREEVAEELAA